MVDTQHEQRSPTPGDQAQRGAEATVRQLMASPVRTVGPGTPIRTVMRMMLYGGIRHVPVVEGGKLVGVLSDRDVLRARSRRQHFEAVRTLMVTDVRTAHPDDTVGKAASQMAFGLVGCLPVVEDGVLVGIITTTDVLAHHAHPRWEQPAPEPRPPQVSDVMMPAPVSFDAEERLLDAVAAMVSRNIRHIPVVDDGRVVGMLSDRDVRAAIGEPLDALRDDEGELAWQTIRPVMTPDPLTVELDTPLGEAASLMLDNGIGAVPVVDGDDMLAGILSYSDLLRYAFVEGAAGVRPARRVRGAT